MKGRLFASETSGGRGLMPIDLCISCHSAVCLKPHVELHSLGR